MSDNPDDRAMVPGVKMEPAAARPVDRLNLIEYVFDGLPMAEVGPSSGLGLQLATLVGKALGYAEGSLSIRLGREWADRLTFETWRTTPDDLQAAIDRAETREVHVVKVEGEMLRDFKALDKLRGSQVVGLRARHLYLITYVGLFHICERLSTKPKALEFQSFMNTHGRRALQTGQALTHDLSGNALPPPEQPPANTDIERERRLMDRERRLMTKTQLGFAKLIATLPGIDPAARSALVLDITQRAIGASVVHALPALDNPSVDATTMARSLMAGPLKGYRVTHQAVGLAAREVGLQGDDRYTKLVATTINGKAREQWRYYKAALEPLAKRLMERSAEGKVPHKLEAS